MSFDVIIVGARVAGAATAMLLARAGLRVLVVDRAHSPVTPCLPIRFSCRGWRVSHGSDCWSRYSMRELHPLRTSASRLERPSSKVSFPAITTST